ncbi:Nuclear SAM-dependent mono-and asymmetric methyltransferase [Entomophthora muscae]|uniref:Nuclear SAM-dependent mono-and asymmetric methyltransferase n=1 Tax=Entomophthora muscae TaxID=34485 RepID=A0ACC2UCR4_9FUNG|nr:Nuclear SAM-dependent mono-and asymmetric methyltransferase [Entomophthora muscae]
MYIAGLEDAEYKEEKLGFWNDVYGFTMSTIHDVAIKEPLVDTVNGDVVVSDPYMFKEIDIYTVKKEDLAFEVPFAIKAHRDDYVHAFICWFDTTFTSCHKHITLSTSPHSKYTHWKQTIFYFPDTLPVKKGDTITGSLSCKPNSRNPRDLDVEIEYSLESAAGSFKDKCSYTMC